MNDKLILEVKRYLKVTWDDEDTNSSIKSIVSDAEIALNHKLGAKIDYSMPGMEHKLFLNYCMYEWNNISSEFDNNYMSDIYQIRAIHEVKYYEENPA